MSAGVGVGICAASPGPRESRLRQLGRGARCAASKEHTSESKGFTLNFLTEWGLDGGGGSPLGVCPPSAPILVHAVLPPSFSASALLCLILRRSATQGVCRGLGVSAGYVCPPPSKNTLQPPIGSVDSAGEPLGLQMK